MSVDQPPCSSRLAAQCEGIAPTSGPHPQSSIERWELLHPAAQAELAARFPAASGAAKLSARELKAYAKRRKKNERARRHATPEGQLTIPTVWICRACGAHVLGRATVSANIYELGAETELGERVVLTMMAVLIQAWGPVAPRVIEQLTPLHIAGLTLIAVQGGDYHEMRSFTVVFLEEAAGDLADIRDELFERYGGGGPFEPPDQPPS